MVKTKRKKQSFFACQPIESEWLSLIKWKKISLNIEKQILFLVSDVVKGDEQSIPDIPSFILAIYVDTEEKMNLISSKKELSCREYFIDEYDNIQVNFHKLIFQIPVEAALNIEQNNQELFDYAKMIHQKEQQSEIYSNKPNFIGDIAQIEGTDSILKKWKENKV